ncbi:M56 family metallopeptidase [Gramella sp. MAR_2010_147]|uniref:M56 family metallopeptidase n=1 Tax=Gramella sp. MAR_2010_147 TaxID=1250205 RepID=UPI00087AFE92|nr:M56 family metallopeptidase [Gramella sp. MAR_2010_147]SDR75830.1 Signal transducer regulating beta-lactamase production, contains metallopeptidase domain [Gramella sp. MAR_2010_147]
MIAFVIKSGLCLLVLFSFYKLFLESENFHKIKRVYLILTLVVSLILPLITISYTIEVPVEEVGETTVWNAPGTKAVPLETPWWQDQLPNILLIIYIIGFLVFSFRFIKNLRALITEANRNDQLKDLPYIYVLLQKKLAPHSFFQYIFLNKKQFRNEKIASAVIEHEKAHVDQKHSFDLLFIELLHIIFWFNPVFIFIQRSIRLNHEFLADGSVLQKAYNPLEYSNILFQYSSGHHHNSLSSPISHSLIKKRIIMITKSFSLKRLVLKSIIFLPVFGGCVYLFNEDIVAKPVLASEENPISFIEAPLKIEDNKHATIKNGNLVNGIQEPKIKIKVEGNKLWLNEKATKPEEFTDAVNDITANWSDEDLKNASIHMNTKNSEPAFMERLDREFANTKLAKISGHGFLPPPPPMPPAAGDVPPPPPPAPEAEHSIHSKDAHRERAREWRHMKDAERKMIAEERKEIQEIKEEIKDDARLTREERAKMQEKVREKQIEINRKMREIERKRRKVEREHVDMDRARKHRDIPVPPNPPAPPNPADAIDDIKREGGSFYYNGKEIDAEKAKQLVQNNDNIQIHVKKGSGENKARFEISDN